MPYSPNDNRYPHLLLVKHDKNPDRRKALGGNPPRPDRGGRGQFAAAMNGKLDELLQEIVQRPEPFPGIKPHLVFRVPLAKGANREVVGDLLDQVGITVVSYEPDGAVIAFRADGDLSRFRRALQEYEQGPRIRPKTGQLGQSTKWDLFEFIEADQMRNWTRRDRVGLRLAEQIDSILASTDKDRLLYLDVELWFRGPSDARRDLDELETIIRRDAAAGEKVCDEFIGNMICLARIALTPAKLNQLLNLDVIAEIDLPPTPVLDRFAAHRATPDNFPSPPSPPEDGPRVCILDSGIASSHPLLKNNVGHTEAILTQSTTPSDAHGHGTRVGGVAVFGDIRAAYTSGIFASPVTLFSARVLNAENRFDDDRLIMNQMDQAIETFKKPPHNCRVFNLSLGCDTPVIRTGGARQSEWAEALDGLARKHKVLLVVSAGNQTLSLANNKDEAERIIEDYPRFLFDDEAALSDPATAAISVTVGSLVQYDVPAVRQALRQNDILLPIANTNQPSPFTRVGLGMNDAIKPEFVDYGGNLAFDGYGSVRRISDSSPDPGLAVMSFSNEPLKTLFAYDIGTSYSAPRVARLAALLWERLRECLGQEPDPNLVRAVLASAARVPDEARSVIERVNGGNGVFRVCGYGMPSEDLALHSGDSRVTLVTQGSIPLDTFSLYEIPILPEFILAPGKKRLAVALAFDPPVRRRRAKYLGVEMALYLFRGKSPDDIEAAYKAVSKEERKTAPKSIKDRSRCPLEPGSTMFDTSTLHRREWVFSRGQLTDGDTYYLMVRSVRNWAAEEIRHQDFGVAVTLEAEEPQLYNLINIRLQQRVRLRA